VVLITTGGNDFLRRLPEADTVRDMTAVVRQVQASGAWPVLFEMPRVSLTAAAGLLSAHGLYADLAGATGVHVIRDTLVDVLSDEALKADAVHPNVRGYTVMAQAAQAVLARCR
jgi:lysophospholipase L1-like esterase